MSRSNTTSIAAVGGLALWSLAICYGFWRMTLYDVTPGASASGATDWPAGLKPLAPALRLASGETKTLVLFAHPQCPCTRATVGNLAMALAHQKTRNSIKVYVVFYEPSKSAGAAWEDSSLVRDASYLPNETTLLDPEGRIMRKFGAETSGQVIAYNASGHMIFSGGVTNGRGQFGDNPGSEAVTQIAEGVSPRARTTQVFGCSLLPGHSARPFFPAGAMPMSAPMRPSKPSIK